MSLRGLFVVTPALGKGKAVMHPGVKLEFTGDARLFGQTLKLLDHRQWSEIVVLGTSNIKLSLYLTQ